MFARDDQRDPLRPPHLQISSRGRATKEEEEETERRRRQIKGSGMLRTRRMRDLRGYGRQTWQTVRGMRSVDTVR